MTGVGAKLMQGGSPPATHQLCKVHIQTTIAQRNKHRELKSFGRGKKDQPESYTEQRTLSECLIFSHKDQTTAKEEKNMIIADRKSVV